LKELVLVHEEGSRETYVILVDDRVGGLGEVVGVEDDRAGLAELVELGGTLGKGVRDGKLVFSVNDNVLLMRSEQRSVLEEAGRFGVINHDEEGNGTMRDDVTSFDTKDEMRG
jgi:hypothetical protein